MKINSKHALLDVPGGQHRQTLERATKLGKRIPVVIQGFIYETWGHYDGISQEFAVEVTSVDTMTAEDKPS